MKAVKVVARCVSLKGNGRYYRVGPVSIATNSHVAQLVLNIPRNTRRMIIDEFNIESSIDILKSYLKDGVSQWKKSYSTLSKYEYNGLDDSEAFGKHINMDPLLGVKHDFDYSDYCVVSLMHHLESHVLFVPSIRVGQIGQGIATISFPCLQGKRQRFHLEKTTVFHCNH